ncbi:hypothetical protein LIP81_19165, partial [Erysipelatoclostridium ramosum]|nr:hypothetical protein [Thomasclavelia ramosa]
WLHAMFPIYRQYLESKDINPAVRIWFREQAKLARKEGDPLADLPGIEKFVEETPTDIPGLEEIDENTAFDPDGAPQSEDSSITGTTTAP